MFKINLVPEAKQQQKRIQKLNITTTTAVTLVGVVILVIVLALLGLRTSKVLSKNSLVKNIESTQTEIKKYSDVEEAVISLKKGLDSIEEITKNSSKWSALFAEVEKATPQDVSFETLNVSGSEVTASLVGSNIDSLARFVESFGSYKIEDKSLFSNIEVDGYTKDESGKVSFDTTFSLNREVLWK